MSGYTKGMWGIDRLGDSIVGIGACYAEEYAGHAWLAVSEADARLIAAAPDLLEALEKAVARQGFSNDELIEAREVIAKAKGKA